MIRSKLRVLLVLAALAVTAPAAAEPTAEDKAQSQALFDEALRLYEAGKFDAALPKLLESNRLDRAAGTMLYAGECYAQLGKTASAWFEFREALDYATKIGNPARAAQAEKRVKELEATLSTLSVALAPGADAIAGLEVKRDDHAIGAAQLGTPVPVDPGQHTIAASAPGRTSFAQTIDVGPNGAHATATIPVLAEPKAAVAPAPAPAPAAAPPRAPAPAPAHASGAQRTIGLVVGGAGIAALGVGAFFGLQAKSKLDDSNDGHCRAGDRCDAIGVALRSDAQSSALVSTIGFGVGVAALAAGAYLFFSAPKETATGAPRLALTPAAGPRGGGFVLTTAF